MVMAVQFRQLVVFLPVMAEMVFFSDRQSAVDNFLNTKYAVEPRKSFSQIFALYFVGFHLIHVIRLDFSQTGSGHMQLPGFRLDMFIS